MRSTLRARQVEAVDMLRSSLREGNRRPMLQAPTGFGKTVVMCAIAEMALAKRRRVLITVPALSLIDQTVRKLFSEGIHDVGVIQADHDMSDPHRAVQVASVQTLQRRELPAAGLVMMDEAHRWFNFYEDWMQKPAWRDVPFVGMSATPWTKGLGRWFDDLLIPATIGDLIHEGSLTPFRVFAPSHPDLSRVRTTAGDYNESDLAGVMNTPTLVADVVSTWVAKGENRPTFVFAVDRAHAKALQREFEAAGVVADYVDAYTDRDEREVIRRRFHDGTCRVVVNVGCLTTGIDWDVRCISLARPTKSEILFVQIIGRGLRTADGKDHLLVFDHSDTHSRLGFVTDIRHDTLDDGRKKAGARGTDSPLPKPCPKCSYMKPPRMAECPQCGFKPERQSTIECLDGELVEYHQTRASDRAEKQKWFSMLIFERDARGYKSGWPAAMYRERFGVWPKGLDPTPAVPDLDVANWITSRRIAFAKRRPSHAGHVAHV